MPNSLITDPGQLVDALIAAGWRVIGPKKRDGAIIYEPLTSGADLPRGLTDDQSPGHYRLNEGDPDRWFDYVVGPQCWKKWLFPARQKLWAAEKGPNGFSVTPHEDDWPKTAFFGVRPCEIAAMGVQDKVFDNGSYADPAYGKRRAETLVVAVQCARSASTCFCAAMDTGPRADSGFDLALTELGPSGGGFLLECASDRGAAVIDGLETAPAGPAHESAAKAATKAAADAQTRTMPAGIAAILKAEPEHALWDEVAERCLACANCTLACPTCFCSDVEDVNDLAIEHAERWRVWDSCFTGEFSYVHGGSVRRSTRSRYRQWMTHKLSSWYDQFGSSGCVGCGRCIAWCPVGIDITEEAAAFAAVSSNKEA